MNDAPGDEERPLAWQAIREHTRVLAADGQEVGTVVEVLGLEQQDIFHGIVVALNTGHREVVIPAEKVGTITNRRLETSLPLAEIDTLELYQPESSFKLGLVGLLGRRLGWVEERDEQP